MKLTSVDIQTDSGYLNSDRQEAQAEQNEAELPISKAASKADVTLPTQSESGISKEATVASSSFVPNYVGKGDEMKLTASFSPVQISSQPSVAPSQPAPAPAPPSPPAAEPYDPGVNETFIPNVERWRNDVVAAIAAYGGPASEVDLFLTIMHRESRGQPDATNPTSGAAGLMQHMPQYWDQRAISAGYAGASPYDPIANINVSAWLLYQAAGGGWGHWSTY